MNYTPLLLGSVGMVLVLLIVLGGVLVGRQLANRGAFDEGHRAGYNEGYAAMKAEHDAYRKQNAIALRAIQNLTPDDPGTLGASLEHPRTFDVSGGFDCHVETARGAQAVGRGRTLEDARAAARRFLNRPPNKYSEVVITKPGADGRRHEVERVYIRRDASGAIVEEGVRARMTPDNAGLGAGELLRDSVERLEPYKRPPAAREPETP